MKNLTALSISISLLGGLATYLAIGPLNGIFLIWAVFVAWGAFFAVGGTADAMKNTIVCGIFGVFLAWAAALIIINLPMAESLGLPLWAGIVVAATVLILCLAPIFRHWQPFPRVSLAMRRPLLICYRRRAPSVMTCCWRLT